MAAKSIGRMLLGVAAVAVVCGCGRNDGFGVPGGLIGGGNGSPNGVSGGRSSTGATGSPGGSGGISGSGGSGTPGGTGVGVASVGLTTGGPGGSGGTGGTGGGTTGKACQTLNDCPNLETICSGGVCIFNFCGPQGKPGPQNGMLDSTCSVQGSDDGSCIPEIQNGKPVGLCSQGGSADAGCDPAAIRPNGLGDACESGDVCLEELGGPQCFHLCDPFATGTAGSQCPNGDECVKPLPSNDRLGVCEPAGATNGTTGGAGTGGTGGVGTGGTGGGTTGDCNPNIHSGEFQNCETSECGCPLKCVEDSVAQVKLCENLCPPACNDPLTVCVASTATCGVVGCGGATGNGAFNSTCTMPDGSAGTCIPITFDGISSVGLCQLAGTATSDCDPNPSVSEAASERCAPGSACFGGFGHSDGKCNDLCDPSSTDLTCPFNQFCSAIVDEPDLFICIGN